MAFEPKAVKAVHYTKEVLEGAMKLYDTEAMNWRLPTPIVSRMKDLFIGYQVLPISAVLCPSVLS